MPRLLTTLSLLVLCACDPFVYEVDVPRLCTRAPAVDFHTTDSGARAVLPLELGLKERLAQQGQMGAVELLSVELEASQDLGATTAVVLRVDPAPQPGSTVPAVELAAVPAPSGTALVIPGQAAELFDALEKGPATLAITLVGAPASDFTAQVTSCAHVRLTKRYLER